MTSASKVKIKMTCKHLCSSPETSVKHVVLVLNDPLLSSVSVSNEAPHIEEDEDEDEQGEKFEFDDSDDMGPPEMSCGSVVKSEWSTDTAVSNLYATTITAQQTAGPAVSGPASTEQEGHISLLYHQLCSGQYSINTITYKILYFIILNTYNKGFYVCRWHCNILFFPDMEIRESPEG